MKISIISTQYRPVYNIVSTISKIGFVLFCFIIIIVPNAVSIEVLITLGAISVICFFASGFIESNKEIGVLDVHENILSFSIAGETWSIEKKDISSIEFKKGTYFGQQDGSNFNRLLGSPGINNFLYIDEVEYELFIKSKEEMASVENFMSRTKSGKYSH